MLSVRSIVAVLFAAVYASTSPITHGAHVTAGAPEHLVALGGECVRLFHSQGDIGCRGLTRTPDMAALYPIETQADLDTWLAAGSSSSDKRALVIPESLVTMDVLDAARDRLAGVFVYPTSDAKNISFASQTPQGDGSADAKLNPFASAKIKWNRDGRALHDRSLPHPVVFLKDETLGKTFLARAKMNIKANSGATYTGFMKYYYGPEKMDSRQCLAFKNIYDQRSPKCDPIGGQSAWGLRGDRSAKDTIVVMTGMDAYAMSQVLAHGANEAASGLVALLAAAKALQPIADSEFNKQIVFAAFQAEKFGFVGSRRFLSDLSRATKSGGAFCKANVTDSSSPLGTAFCTSPMLTSVEFAKLNLARVTHAIAVDQVGLLDTTKPSFSVHVNPNAPSAAATKLVDAIVKAPSANAKFAKGTVSKALPPTPLLSFVNEGEFGRKDLVSAVLAGYDTSFVGEGVYASRHDVVEKLDIDAVVLAAQVLAESVYQLGAKTPSSTSLKKIQVDKTLVKDMLNCITNDWSCDLMRNHSKPFVQTMIKYLDLGPNSYPTYKQPVSLYSGPINSDRQPLVIDGFGGDSAKYVTDYTKAWSDETNRMNLFPNAYEVFTRSFLASALADETAKVSSDKTCTVTQDCGAKGVECVYPGICVKQRAYFHDAYSPGLNRTSRIGIYDVVDETMPLWTEPQWDGDVGSYVFPDPGEAIGWIALAIGIVVSGVGVVLARWLLTSVHKMKLL